MELFPIEIRPPFQPPSEDAKLVLLADGGIHFDGADLRRHLSRCVRYAREHRVHLVSGLFVHEGNLCLCLLGPDGQALCRQPALHLSLPLRARCARGSGPRSCTPSWETSSSASTRTSTTRRSSGPPRSRGRTPSSRCSASTRRRRPPSASSAPSGTPRRATTSMSRTSRRAARWSAAPRRHPRGGRLPGAAHRRAARAFRAQHGAARRDPRPVRADGTDQPGACGELRRRTGEVAVCGKRFWGC